MACDATNTRRTNLNTSSNYKIGRCYIIWLGQVEAMWEAEVWAARRTEGLDAWTYEDGANEQLSNAVDNDVEVLIHSAAIKYM